MSATDISPRHRVCLSVEIDFDSDASGLNDAKRELEFAAAEAIEAARARIEEKTSAVIDAYVMRASSMPVSVAAVSPSAA